MAGEIARATGRTGGAGSEIGLVFKKFGEGLAHTVNGAVVADADSGFVHKGKSRVGIDKTELRASVSDFSANEPVVRVPEFFVNDRLHIGGNGG